MEIVSHGFFTGFINYTEEEQKNMDKLSGLITLNDLRVYLKRHNLELENHFMKLLDINLFGANVPFSATDSSKISRLSNALQDRVYKKVDPEDQDELNEELENCYLTSKRKIRKLSKCEWARKYDECEMPTFTLIEKMIRNRDLKIVEDLNEEFVLNHTYEIAVSADELRVIGSDSKTIILSDRVEWPKFLQQIYQKRKTENFNFEA